MKYFLLLLLITLQNGCAHFGLDSPADVSAENCYAYRYGDKLRRINFVQAFDWCQRSAHFGNANSQTLLAELYYMGLGGDYDISQAEIWFLKAAKQGHAHAQFMLYEINLPLSDATHKKQALFWLRQAKQSGYPLALDVK